MKYLQFKHTSNGIKKVKMTLNFHRLTWAFLEKCLTDLNDSQLLELEQCNTETLYTTSKEEVLRLPIG